MPEPEPLRVFGWMAGTDACAYYRLVLPLAELARRGHRAVAGQFATPGMLEWCDVIVGQRISTPNTLEVWRRWAAEGRTLVYETDDDLWNVDPTNSRAWAVYRRPEVQATMTEAVRLASAVTCSTEPLAERLRSMTDRPVYVLPNCIDEVGLIDPGAVVEDTPVTVGWAGGDSHGMDWAEHGRAIRRTVGRHWGVRMRWIGARYDRADRVGLWECPAEFVPGTPDIHAYYRLLDGLAVGVAPLKTHVFNRSKSHIKALEYAARGIPCVASDEPPYSGFVRHGETGLLVRREHEWATHLDHLIRHTDARRAMAAAARAEAARWTIQARAHLWEGVYRQVLADRTGVAA